jgi:hypothetical protein
MLFRSAPVLFYGDEKTRRLCDDIRQTMTSRPVQGPVPTSGCTVMDDHQWRAYKKHIARIAKERKKAISAIK